MVNFRTLNELDHLEYLRRNGHLAEIAFYNLLGSIYRAFIFHQTIIVVGLKTLKLDVINLHFINKIYVHTIALYKIIIKMPLMVFEPGLS